MEPPRATHTALAAFLLLFAENASAYLDPGTGSIILQGLIATVAAIAAYAGLYWQRVKAFFQRSGGGKSQPASKQLPVSDDDQSN
jgi:hypothetical protein